MLPLKMGQSQPAGVRLSAPVPGCLFHHHSFSLDLTCLFRLLPCHVYFSGKWPQTGQT